MNMMENQTRQYSNEELRARFNPEGSLLWKHQQRMVELLLAFDTICKRHTDWCSPPSGFYSLG